MKADIFEEKTKELNLEIGNIITMLKTIETPTFLNGVLINYNAFWDLLEDLRHIRYGVDHLNHIFIMIQGVQAEKRTNDFIMKLIKGDLVMPALEGKK